MTQRIGGERPCRGCACPVPRARELAQYCSACRAQRCPECWSCAGQHTPTCQWTARTHRAPRPAPGRREVCGGALEAGRGNARTCLPCYYQRPRRVTVGEMLIMSKVVKVHVSPVRLLSELERAEQALPPGHQCPASEAVHYAVTKLAAARQVQDAALDEATRTPEPQAARVSPPQGEGTEA